LTFSLHDIRHLLIDLDGVLYRGVQPLPGASEFVQWLRDREVSFRLVTNNATLTPGQYIEKLAKMGIAVERDEIFTSALATALYLQHERPVDTEQTAYVIGEEGLVAALRAIDVRITDQQPEWVVVGLDRNITYDKLATACLAIRAGAGFLGSNPDTSFPSEHGLVPGAGSLLAALQAATGVQPVVVGKPQPLMLQLAMEGLGGTPENTAMLGDRLDTDILGAHNLGMPSILVLTGVSTREELAQSPYAPELVVDDLAGLIGAWQAAGAPAAG
jgi:4-nitrophenyl phosphatase